MSESRKFVDKLCAVDIRKITWYQNVFGRIHRHCSNRRRIHGWMYAKKPKRTLEHINKMIMCFCLPPFHLLFSVSLPFGWWCCCCCCWVSARLYLSSFSFFFFYLLRIKFRSTACLWAWSQWPTTTGLLHIIPNSNTELSVFFFASLFTHTARMYINKNRSTQLKPCEKKLFHAKIDAFQQFFCLQ